MDKINEQLVQDNLSKDPSRLSEEVERLLVEQPVFREDLIDFLSDLLNEQIKKVNDAKFKYLAVVNRKQYVNSLVELVGFTNKLTENIDTLHAFSVAAIHKIKELEGDAVTNVVEELRGGNK